MSKPMKKTHFIHNMPLIFHLGHICVSLDARYVGDLESDFHAKEREVEVVIHPCLVDFPSICIELLIFCTNFLKIFHEKLYDFVK